jgi:protein gp37
VRFLSIEPLLEDIGAMNLSGTSWVIVGGESLPGARPMKREGGLDSPAAQDLWRAVLLQAVGWGQKGKARQRA